MSRLRILTALTAVVLVLAASPWCWATPSVPPSLTLTSSGGGIYDYGLVVLSGPPIITDFAPNATITLSGFSGVTGASTASPLSVCFIVNSFTPSSVIYGAPSGCILAGPATVGTLVVDSSVLTLGTVDFSMTPTSGTVTGTTQGPVAAVPVPEPAGLMLLGTGLLGLVGLARRKSSRDSA